MSDMITVKQNFDELKEWMDKMPDELDDAVIRGTRNYAIDLFNLTQELCPVDTGQLRRSGQLVIRKYGFKITYGGVLAPYAAAVHFGYKQHWIAPKHKKVLAWVVKGRGMCTPNKSKRGLCAFSKGHYVPRSGRSKPNPWVFNALFKMKDGWKKAILKELNEIGK